MWSGITWRQVTVSRLPLLRGVRCFPGKHLFGRSPRQLLHMVKAMGEAADTHRQGTQLDDQIVELALRQMGADHIPAGPIGLGIVTEGLAASTGNQPLYPSGEGVWH